MKQRVIFDYLDDDEPNHVLFTMICDDFRDFDTKIAVGFLEEIGCNSILVRREK